MKNKHRTMPDGSIAIFMKKPGTGRAGIPRETISTYISAEDYERVAAISGSWYARDVQEGVSYTRYAITCFYEGGKARYIYLHRYIMDAPESRDVDHKDRNGLNNRRDNLRIFTRAENNANRRKFHRGRKRASSRIRDMEREYYKPKKAAARKSAAGEVPIDELFL